MADGQLRASCRNFEPSYLNKDKCLNCSNLKDSHRKPPPNQEPSGHGLSKKGSGARVSRLRTVVKSGALTVAVQKAKDVRLKWNKRWIVLDSTGNVEYFLYDEQKDRSKDVLEGSFNLDSCGGMFVGEYDTGEPFSMGLKFPDSTLFFRAENRLEMDNWSRVLRPFVQAAQPLPSYRGRSSSGGRPASNSAEPGINQSPTESPTTDHVPHAGRLARAVTLPRAASPRARGLGTDEDDAAVKSVKAQVDQLREENKKLSELSQQYARQAESAHILEQELKTKNHQLKELEKRHCQCKDYQKAVILQERELQEANSNNKALKKELEEAEKTLRQQRGKMTATGKELLEAKSDLEQADSIISIHKANIEHLKSELGNLKQDLSTSKGTLGGEFDAEPLGRVTLVEETQTNGNEREGDQTKDLEKKLSLLMQKFKQNERELLVKGRELEKANESRSKVARYTRSLLQELEGKLGQNEKRLHERDNELLNVKLELDYEKEKRLKLEEDNERMLTELEKVREEKRKGEFPKGVVKLLDQAKEAPLLAVETELAEAGVDESFGEKVHDGNDGAEDEVSRLRSALKSMETQASERQSMLDENQSVLESTNVEIGRLREERNSLVHQLEVAKCDELTELLKKKDNEIASLRKEIRYLGDMNSDLSDKNRGLDERLQTVENELNESVEKEIILQQENETMDEESTDHAEKIAGLEEELSIARENIASLELKLAAVGRQKLGESKDEGNKHDEAELRLKDLENELLQKERLVEKLREKYESDLSDGRAEYKRDIRDLEQRLKREEESLKDTEIRLEEKERELRETVRHFKNQSDHGRIQDLETKLNQKEEALCECREHLRKAEEDLGEYKSRLNLSKSLGDNDRLTRVGDNGELNTDRLDELERKLADAVDKIEEYEVDIQKNNCKLQASDEKVVELAEELARRLREEGETVQWIEEVESSLKRREVELSEARQVMSSKAQELDQEKVNVLDRVQLSTAYTKELESALGEERNTVRALEQKLLTEERKVSELQAKLEVSSTDRPDGNRRTEELRDRLLASERQLEIQTAQIAALRRELQEQETEFNRRLDIERHAFDTEVRKMNEDALRISGAASTEADELKLRLTSRVITLQSDISELKAAHQQEIEGLRVHYRKLEQDRNEALLESSAHSSLAPDDAANSSIMEWEADMKSMVERYETHMEHLKASHGRDMAKLTRSSGDRSDGDGLQTEVAQLQTELESINRKYVEEIEMLKNEHADELEQLKKDMAVVLQASLAPPGTASAHKPGGDDAGNVTQLKARIRELEAEIDELSRKYNEEIKAEREAQQREIEQTRQDMMTVIQAIRSEKYKLDSDAEEDSSPRRARELQRELEKTHAQYEAKLAQQKEQYEKQLSEMRVDRGLITITGGEDPSKLLKRIKELEAEIADMRKEFEVELSRKEEEHGDEVNQLKVDMLVALQVARSGNASPVHAHQDEPAVTETISQAREQLTLEEAKQAMAELTEKNKALEKQIADEKEETDKMKQKSEAAVMFGLRRNEDMSMKIYKMQKEMEAMESKHAKEVHMYREAVEREMEKRGDVGDAAVLASENETLRLAIEECELNTEKRENVLRAEIEMYKDKLHKESVQNVEKLKFQIKSLEDVIGEMRLEHGKELEDLKEERERTMGEIKNRHEEEIKQLSKEKPALRVEPAAPSKDAGKKERERLRECELRIEELEALLSVKKRRHSEEIRKLREKLQQELQSHTDEVRDYRRRIRELERARNRSDSGGAALELMESKRKLEQQRADNQKLKSAVDELKAKLEELKKELDASNKAAASAAAEHQKPTESRRPMSEVYPSGYSAFSRTSAQATSAVPTKEPLRKVSSLDSRSPNSESSNRRSPSTNAGQQKPGISDKARTFPRQWPTESKWHIARQSSKIDSNSIGSVASRVAMYQTAVSKNKVDEQTSGKKS